MAVVLADPALYAYTGGEPPEPMTLRARYVRQAVGVSPDGSELWFNWIIRTRASGTAVGYVQATLVSETGTTDLAWVIGRAFQRQGFASEAVAAALRWLASRADVRRLTAHIAASNLASEGAARRSGFASTGRIENGEVVWELDA